MASVSSSELAFDPTSGTTAVYSSTTSTGITIEALLYSITTNDMIAAVCVSRLYRPCSSSCAGEVGGQAHEVRFPYK